MDELDSCLNRTYHCYYSQICGANGLIFFLIFTLSCWGVSKINWSVYCLLVKLMYYILLHFTKCIFHFKCNTITHYFYLIPLDSHKRLIISTYIHDYIFGNINPILVSILLFTCISLDKSGIIKTITHW